MTLKAADDFEAIARRLNELRGSAIPAPDPIAPQPAPVAPIGTIQTPVGQDEADAWDNWASHMKEPDGFAEDHRQWPELTGCMWSWLAANGC